MRAPLGTQGRFFLYAAAPVLPREHSVDRQRTDTMSLSRMIGASVRSESSVYPKWPGREGVWVGWLCTRLVRLVERAHLRLRRATDAFP
ncbi:hypothetical protein BD311DRAFT_760248 [Dichomitus squalens]|uniref:Uncharacterized protein n=1 Tax=Dichomitus squalens TaxID=114155 RepID=A0A4Q9MJ11_9APHY|nr:hypothetical protein BD311DRAFT_760248 [Dichomitus squalens]